MNIPMDDPFPGEGEDNKEEKQSESVEESGLKTAKARWFCDVDSLQCETKAFRLPSSGYEESLGVSAQKCEGW